MLKGVVSHNKMNQTNDGNGLPAGIKLLWEKKKCLYILPLYQLCAYKPFSPHFFLPNPDFYFPTVKSFENTVGKGEIARNQQFLLFPQCFLPDWRNFFHFHQI